MYLHTLSPPDSLPICFPVLSTGFEIETEISVHALELKMPVAEIDTPYFARIEGSESKLSTYGDGFRILRTIVSLYRIERPMLRSAERRVGKGGVSTCRSRWSPVH